MLRPLCALMTGVATMAICAPAIAQTADGAVPTAPGEIVVTAQKRAERLQDVPVAVSAVTADSLARAQINDTASLSRAVPSLTFQQGQGSQSNGFRIRGVGSQLFSLGVEASVSTVVDGVVAARATQGFSDFADIERIEVLRGPQGTLFGKNATAGVVSVITAKPSRKPTASMEATIAEKGEYRVKGTVSGPLSETVAARISAYYNDVDGYIYNVATKRNVNGSKSWGVRGKLLWDATENLNFLASADYRKSNALCCQSVAVQTVTPAVIALSPGITASPTNRRIIDDSDSFNNESQYTLSLEGNLDLGGATVTSITAYQHYENDANNVVDRINNPLPVYTGGIAQFNQNGGTIGLSSFSQELRIGSNGKSDLTYVAGVFYANTSVTRDFLRRQALCSTGTLGDVCAAPTYRSVFSHAYNKSESVSAFGQLEYRVVGNLKLLGGARLQREKTSVDGVRYGPAPQYPTDAAIPGFGAISGYRSASDTALTGKVGAKYEFSRNAQTYASFTRGYKGYGFNTEPATNFATQTPVLPEYVNAFEVGFKGRTRDNLLSVTFAAFLSNYTNLQVLANVGTPSAPAFAQTNAGKSTTKGFEIEGTLRPSNQFSVGFGVTYAKSTITADGLSCALQNQANLYVVPIGGTPPANTCYGSGTGQQNIVNGRLPYAPEWRIMVSPRYEADIPGTNLTGFGQFSVNYQSRQIFDISQDPMLTQKPYAMVDASIGVQGPDKHYTFTVFVRNLLNQNYYSSMAHTSLLASATNANDLTAFVNKDANRYFGATFGARF
ncbi:TonB-dependent receptor [Novosphingobium sp. SG707]|uniref:TonB-dependent receptor n=1 Tax=Novosphingobium sp. SG707 TaxID=2586996 RepID=UPI0017F5B823|nr:TonB-dependent receptor [Novosphingobium sp. SG707]NKI98800.1 iron complex outermembrane receptor protein [Novosphingobium sp. SG707]